MYDARAALRENLDKLHRWTFGYKGEFSKNVARDLVQQVSDMLEAETSPRETLALVERIATHVAAEYEEDPALDEMVLQLWKAQAASLPDRDTMRRILTVAADMNRIQLHDREGQILADAVLEALSAPSEGHFYETPRPVGFPPRSLRKDSFA